MVEVTQEDREAAANYLAVPGGTTWGLEYIRDGMDDDSFPVQAFARHRIAARNAALERAAKVADELGGVRPKTADQEPFRAQHTRANTIATAIRNLKGPSNAD